MFYVYSVEKFKNELIALEKENLSRNLTDDLMHEVLNPLMIAKGNSQILNNSVDPGQEGYLQNIDKSLGRIENLIHQINIKQKSGDYSEISKEH